MSVKSTIGLKNLVTAEVNVDSENALTYFGVEPVVAAISIDISDASGDADIQAADDREYDRLYPKPKLTFKMEQADIPPAMLAKFFGHAVDANGVTVYAESDRPPYRAFGFKSEKADGTYRYVWLLKCIPSKRSADAAYKTKEDGKIERQTKTIEFGAIPTDYTKNYQFMVDDDTAAFSTKKATFFDAPYVAQVAENIVINTQPLDQYLATAAAGSAVVEALVDGSAPAGYQWYKAAGRAYSPAAASTYAGNATKTLTLAAGIPAGTHYFYCKLTNPGSPDVYTDIVVLVKG